MTFLNKLKIAAGIVIGLLLAFLGIEYRRGKEAEALQQNADTRQKDLDLQKQQEQNNAVIASEEQKIADEKPPVAGELTKDETEEFWNGKK